VDVLQPVNRRRRRRRRVAPWIVAALASAAVAVGAAAVVLLLGGGTARRSVTPPPPPARHARVLLHVRRPPRPHSVPLLRLGRARFGAPLPRIQARAAIVVDDATGAVLYRRDVHRKLPIASTTKIMTALLVLRHDRLGAVVRIAPSVPLVPLVKEGLRAGEHVPVWKLLYGLLLYSGNDDALALALATSGSRPAFLRLMNAEARRLRLDDTHFNSPSGVLDERNYSSAWDLAALTRVALRNATFRRIVATRVERVRWAPPTYAKVYVNRNLLLWSYPGTIGVKTGFTTVAGDCLVAAATRHGRTLIVVLLHDPETYADAIRLFDRGWRVRSPAGAANAR